MEKFDPSLNLSHGNVESLRGSGVLDTEGFYFSSIYGDSNETFQSVEVKTSMDPLLDLQLEFGYFLPV